MTNDNSTITIEQIIKPVITKRCSKCSQEKQLSEFGRQSSTKDKLKYQCKSCDKSRNQTRYQNNLDTIRSQVKLWQAAHPEKVKAYQKKYKSKVKPV